MRRSRIALAAGLAASLAACAPFPYGPYWRPEADGGRYARAWCGGQEGPITTVELTLADGVTANARVNEGSNGTSLFVVLRVEGEPVRFEPTLRVESASGVHVLSAQLRRTLIEGAAARRVEIGDTLGPVGGRPGVANLEVLLPASVGSFTLWLPQGQRGGGKIVPPPVRFERRTMDAGFQAFNC